LKPKIAELKDQPLDFETKRQLLEATKLQNPIINLKRQRLNDEDDVSELEQLVKFTNSLPRVGKK